MLPYLEIGLRQEIDGPQAEQLKSGPCGQMYVCAQLLSPVWLFVTLVGSRFGESCLVKRWLVENQAERIFSYLGRNIQLAILFYSDLQLLDWGSNTLGRAICFIQSTDFNDNLIQKLHQRNTQNNIWPNIWAELNWNIWELHGQVDT